MQIKIFEQKDLLGAAGSAQASHIIENKLATQHQVNLILATGASQFETLKHLAQEPGIDWSRVNMFHLDEYVGISDQHPASFRKYLQERFIDKTAGLKEVFFIQGDHADPLEECKRLNAIIARYPIDLAFVGIGENGHLAFNDPPADFNTEDPYIVVKLDEACRRQQMGEGWFASLEDVPEEAISMSIKQIMKSEHIICSVPDERKAEAVKKCLEGEVSNLHPASILKKHSNCIVLLDTESASLLEKK